MFTQFHETLNNQGRFPLNAGYRIVKIILIKDNNMKDKIIQSNICREFKYIHDVQSNSYKLQRNDQGLDKKTGLQ